MKSKEISTVNKFSILLVQGIFNSSLCFGNRATQAVLRSCNIHTGVGKITLETSPIIAVYIKHCNCLSTP